MSKKAIESILFVSKSPISIEEIASHLSESNDVILRWLMELEKEYHNRGIRINQVAGGFLMSTPEECDQILEDIKPRKKTTLSKAVTETLAAVAYHQPASRDTIKSIRRVKNPDYGIDQSIERGLIQKQGDEFITTKEFLNIMGINDIQELNEKQKKDVYTE